MASIAGIKDKQVKIMVLEAVKQGARVREGSHLTIKCPWHGTQRCRMASGIVVVPTTPKASRALNDYRTKMKRCGYDV